MNSLIEIPLIAWLASYLLHSTLLLGVAWLLDVSGLLRRSASRAFAWKAAALGALLTASIQTFAPAISLTELPQAAVSAPPSMSIANGTADSTPSSVAYNLDTEIAAAPAPVAAPVAGSERGMHFAPRWPLETMLLAAWMLLAALLVVRVANTLRMSLHDLADRTPIVDGPLHDSLRQLCEQAKEETGRRVVLPRLSMVGGLSGPLTLPTGEICLPPWSAELAPSQRDAMIAHELAHVIRRDAQWQLLLMTLSAVFFFQPLNLLAHRRVCACAELSADNLAVQLAGSGRSLAEVLAECATRISTRHRAVMSLGAAMAQRRSPLVQRVERALGGVRVNDHKPSHGARIAVATAIVAALLILPAITTHTVEAGPTHVSIHEDGDRNELRFEFVENGRTLRVEAEGKVHFTADERDVESLSRDGRLDILEKRDGTRRELVITNVDGKLQRSYRVDNGEAAFDDEAAQWFAEIIPHVLRNTALDAERRVERLLATGGADAVIQEIALIVADFAQTRYVGLLTSKADLTNAQVQKLLGTLDGLSSDHEMRQALGHIASGRELDIDTQVKLLQRAKSISSDFELAELLRQITPKLTKDETVLATWRETASEISSDFEMRRVLSDVVEDRRMPQAWQAAALELGGQEISSDFELRSLLDKAAAAVEAHRRLLVSYLEALDAISSDFEAREAVVALVGKSALDAEGYADLLEHVKAISSDFECSQALQAIAKRMPRDPSLVEKYREVARNLSNHERAEAERALDRG